MDMSGYTGSNFYRAQDLEPGVLIETTIVSITLREFEEGGKLVAKPVAYTDYQGKGLVLNPTRTKALCRAFGSFSENWVGKPIIISLGDTVYAGEKVGAVVVEGVVAGRIGTDPKPALGRGSRPAGNATDIRSGKGAWDDAPLPESDNGPGDPEDDIPF